MGCISTIGCVSMYQSVSQYLPSAACDSSKCLRKARASAKDSLSSAWMITVYGWSCASINSTLVNRSVLFVSIVIEIKIKWECQLTYTVRQLT